MCVANTGCWDCSYAFLPGVLLWYLVKDVKPDEDLEWTMQNPALQSRIASLEKHQQEVGMGLGLGLGLGVGNCVGLCGELCG